jgi:hypothetical protein
MAGIDTYNSGRFGYVGHQVVESINTVWPSLYAAVVISGGNCFYIYD